MYSSPIIKYIILQGTKNYALLINTHLKIIGTEMSSLVHTFRDTSAAWPHHVFFYIELVLMF